MTDTEYQKYVDELWVMLDKELVHEKTAIGKAKLVFLILDGVTVEDLMRAGIDLGRARTLIFQNFLTNKFIRRVERRVYEVTKKGAKEFRKPPRKRGRPTKTIKVPAGLTVSTHTNLMDALAVMRPVLKRIVKLNPTTEREPIRYQARCALVEINMLIETLQ